jgi:AcrR family transcriptional regulator
MQPLVASCACVNKLQEGRELSVTECPSLSRAELRRQNIKHVARRLFVEHGFHRTGIALIAKASGVAVQQLYRDFPAKEDIIAAIVEEDCGRFANLAALELALEQEDRAAIRAWLTSAVSRCDPEGDRLFLEIAAEAARNERIRSIFSGTRLAMFANVSRAFAGLTGQRTVQEDHRVLAEALLVASMGSVCNRALHGVDSPVSSIKLISCLIDGEVGSNMALA